MPYHDEDGTKMKKILVKEKKKPKKKQSQIFEIKKKMTNADRFKEHQKHHSKKHIKMMKDLIKKGKTFNQAHKEVMKKIGK